MEPDFRVLPDRFKVGCLQFDVRRGNPTENVDSVARLLAVASARGCLLVILPEMWSAGFSGEGLWAEAERLSERLDFMANEARRHRLWIAAGSLPEPATPPRVYNTLYLLDPLGNVRWSCRKVHLFPDASELNWFQAADQHAQPLRLGAWTIGGGVCYDLRMPELFRCQVKAQANLFLLPAQFPDPRLEHFALLCRCRALENLSYFVGVNRIGRDGARTYSGGSLVVDPLGRVRGMLAPEEAILDVEVDVETVHSCRRQYPFLEHTLILDRLTGSTPANCAYA